MKDIEDQLKALTPTKPSRQFEGRMAQLFASATATSPRAPLTKPVPLWACAVACAVFAFVGYHLNRQVSPVMSITDAPTQRVIYVIQSDSNDPGNVFDWAHRAPREWTL